MQLPPFKLHQPAHLDQALALKQQLGDQALFLAGGSELLPRLKLGATRARHLISLQGLPELAQRRTGPAGLQLGASLRLQELAEDEHLQLAYTALAQAAAQVAGPQARSLGTLGGNLCQDTRCLWFNRSSALAAALAICYKRGGDVCVAMAGARRCLAVYQGDLAAPLLALGAWALTSGPDGQRQMDLAALFSGHGQHPLALPPDQVLTAVLLPPPEEGARSGYRKFRLRQGLDYPLAGWRCAGCPRAGCAWASPPWPAGLCSCIWTKRTAWMR